MIFKGKVAEPDRVSEYVYNPLNEQIVAEIKGGLFETSDPAVIEVMKAQGYEVLDAIPVDPEAELKTGEGTGEEMTQVDEITNQGPADQGPADQGPAEDGKLSKLVIRQSVETGTTDILRVKDLISFAEENNIDLGDARKKDDIIMAILATE
jgi:hypothetical protein